MLVFFCIIASISGIFLAMLEAFLVSHIIDDVLYKNGRNLSEYFTLLCIGITSGIIVTYATRNLFGFLSAKVLKDLRLEVLKHILKLSAENMESKHSGDLLNRFSSDISVKRENLWQLFS